MADRTLSPGGDDVSPTWGGVMELLFAQVRLGVSEPPVRLSIILGASLNKTQ